MSIDRDLCGVLEYIQNDASTLWGLIQSSTKVNSSQRADIIKAYRLLTRVSSQLDK